MPGMEVCMMLMVKSDDSGDHFGGNRQILPLNAFHEFMLRSSCMRTSPAAGATRSKAGWLVLNCFTLMSCAHNLFEGEASC